MIKITIEKVVEPTPDEKYPKDELVYQQIVENIDLVKVIKAINQIESV